MVKSNKVIYPWKIKFPKEFKLHDMKDQFNKDKVYENIIDIDDRDYSASLEFLYEDHGVMFFALNKFDNKNITVTDFAEKKDHRSYLKNDQKVKNYSLFAIVKEYNMLLVLFNHKGFGYVLPTLHKYFEKILNIEFEARKLTRDYNDEDIKKYCKGIRHVHIVRQRENFRTFENETNTSSRKKLKKYKEKKEETIKLQRITKLPFSLIFGYIKEHMKKDYDKIIINSRSIGDINILDEYIIHFPCNISIDDDNLANQDEFKNKVQEINEEEKKLFKRY